MLLTDSRAPAVQSNIEGKTANDIAVAITVGSISSATAYLTNGMTKIECKSQYL